MKFYFRILAPVLIISALLIIGCSDRGANGGDYYTRDEGGPLIKNHVFFDEFIVQIKNEFQLLEMAAYIPKVSYPVISGGELRPVPLLILLPPQGKDQYFYFSHGLEEIADELISTGQIQPMAIVCISNDLVFGGYFYGSRYPGAGNYDALVGGTLVDYIYSDYCPFAINDPAKRAIGGVGQGAYGAFRAALLNPGTFCSISAVDGPLDFDGASGTGGYVALFEDAIIEQGLLGRTPAPPNTDDTSFWHNCDPLEYLLCECVDSMEIYRDSAYYVCADWDTLYDTTFDTSIIVPDTTVDTIVDSTEFCAVDSLVTFDDLYDHYTVDTLWPPSWRQLFDSSAALPLSNQIIGASLAFSPHDTSVHCTSIVSADQLNLTVEILSREVNEDTLTLVKELIDASVNDFDFHLPFDSTGALYGPIWDNYWVPNNLESLLAGSTLDGVNMWIATSDEAGFGYHEQTTSWISTLQTAGYPVSTRTYSGYEGNPANNDEYVYDLLKEMLIFHSECFGD